MSSMPQSFDNPPHLTNPYPPAGTRPVGFRYNGALVLLRLQDAPALRATGSEDADYILGHPFEVTWTSDTGDEVSITVPAGMKSDLTSVPRYLRWIAGRVGPWLEAAIVHDFLYIAWQSVPDRGPNNTDRRFADDIMLVAMRAAKVPAWLARAIWLGVRLGGSNGYYERQRGRYANLDHPAIRSQLAFLVPFAGPAGQSILRRT